MTGFSDWGHAVEANKTQARLDDNNAGKTSFGRRISRATLLALLSS